MLQLKMHKAIVLIACFYLSITSMDCASLNNPNLSLLTPSDKIVNGTSVDTNKPSSDDALPKAALPPTSGNVNTMLSNAENVAAANIKDDSQKGDLGPKTTPNVEENSDSIATPNAGKIVNDSTVISPVPDTEEAEKVQPMTNEEKNAVSPSFNSDVEGGLNKNTPKHEPQGSSSVVNKDLANTATAESNPKDVGDVEGDPKHEPQGSSSVVNKDLGNTATAESIPKDVGDVEGDPKHEPQDSSSSVNKDQGKTATAESIPKDVGVGTNDKPGQEESANTDTTAHQESETEDDLTADKDAAHSNNEGHENVPKSETLTLDDVSDPKTVEDTKLPPTDKTTVIVDNEHNISLSQSSPSKDTNDLPGTSNINTGAGETGSSNNGVKTPDTKPQTDPSTVTEDTKNLKDTSDISTGADMGDPLTEEGKVPDDEHHIDKETASKEHADSSDVVGADPAATNSDPINAEKGGKIAEGENENVETLEGGKSPPVSSSQDDIHKDDSSEVAISKEPGNENSETEGGTGSENTHVTAEEHENNDDDTDKDLATENSKTKSVDKNTIATKENGNEKENNDEHGNQVTDEEPETENEKDVTEGGAKNTPVSADEDEDREEKNDKNDKKVTDEEPETENQNDGTEGGAKNTPVTEDEDENREENSDGEGDFLNQEGGEIKISSLDDDNTDDLYQQGDGDEAEGNKQSNVPDAGNTYKTVDFENDDEPSSSFFTFILFAMFSTATLYLLYHNKRKVMAYIRPSSQRKTGSRYRGKYDRLENQPDDRAYRL